MKMAQGYLLVVIKCYGKCMYMYVQVTVSTKLLIFIPKVLEFELNIWSDFIGTSFMLIRT